MRRAAAAPPQTSRGAAHTTRYHAILLRAVPHRCDLALDVGCGTGAFARKLAGRSRTVHGLDADLDVLLAASSGQPHAANIRWICADFLAATGDGALRHGRYDFVSASASLHHMDLAAALARAAALLRPGGVLAVIGLFSERGILDHLASVAALLESRVLVTPEAIEGTAAPLRAPTLTMRAIRRVASQVLPGSVVRRRLLWRYTLLYRRPAG